MITNHSLKQCISDQITDWYKRSTYITSGHLQTRRFQQSEIRFHVVYLLLTHVYKIPFFCCKSARANDYHLCLNLGCFTREKRYLFFDFCSAAVSEFLITVTSYPEPNLKRQEWLVLSFCKQTQDMSGAFKLLWILSCHTHWGTNWNNPTPPLTKQDVPYSPWMKQGYPTLPCLMKKGALSPPGWNRPPTYPPFDEIGYLICPVARYICAGCPVLNVTYQVSCSDRR